MTLSNFQTKCYGVDYKTSPHSIRTSTVVHSRVVSRNCTSRQLSLLEKFAPDYEAIPYWDLEPVPPNESLPGQRYRLVLVHGNLKRCIPVQLDPEKATTLHKLVSELDYDWSLDLDTTGQLCNFEARSALACLFGALGGAA